MKDLVRIVALCCLVWLALTSLHASQETLNILASSQASQAQIYEEVNLGSSVLPIGISPALDGGVWVAEANTDNIVHIDESGSIERVYSLSSQKHLAFIWSMVEDNFGTLWIADESLPYLLGLNISSGRIMHVSTGNIRPYALAYDKTSGKLWFTSFDDSYLGYLTITVNGIKLGNETSIRGLSGIGAGPSGIALGKGFVFVAESLNSSIDMYFASNMSLDRVWYLPPASQPVGLSYDQAEDLLWFTNHATSLFGFINLKTNEIVQFATSVAYNQGLPIVSLPYWIKQASDGVVWFNEHFGNKIAAFNLKSMTLTEFIIPENGSSPLQLAVDNSFGKVWFTEFTTGKVGYISEDIPSQVEITLPETVNLSPFNTNFEIDVNNWSKSLVLSGSMNRLGVLNTNMTVQVNSLSNGSIYQITLSNPSMSFGNYTLTACVPGLRISSASTLLVNQCKIFYLRYSLTPSQANDYLIFPVLGLLAIIAYYIIYQRSARKRVSHNLERKVKEAS